MPSDSTFLEVKNAFQSIAGLESLTVADEFFLVGSLNRAVYRAYNQSDNWQRYLVAGEARTITSSTLIPYTEAGETTIGEFLRIHKAKPFQNSTVLEFDFYVDSSGANITNIGYSGETVAYVTYKTTVSTNYTQDSTDIPSEFVDYIIYTALSDFYTGDGQTEKAAIASRTADLMLAREMMLADKRTSKSNISKRIRTYGTTQRRN
jgi:hypothetical protein